VIAVDDFRWAVDIICPRSSYTITSAPANGTWSAAGTSASPRDQIAVTWVCLGGGASASRISNLEPSSSSRVGWPSPIALTSVPMCGEPSVIR
jgi:hypothetical protein